MDQEASTMLPSWATTLAIVSVFDPELKYACSFFRGAAIILETTPTPRTTCPKAIQHLNYSIPFDNCCPPSFNGAQNETFEALVDLLATDGTDYVPSTSSVPRDDTILNDSETHLEDLILQRFIPCLRYPHNPASFTPREMDNQRWLIAAMKHLNVHDKGKPFESMAMNCKRWSPKVRKRKGGQKESAGNSRSRATQIAAAGEEPGPSCMRQTVIALVDIAVEPQVVNMEDPNRHSKPKSSGGVVAEVAQLSEEEPKQVIVPTLNIRPSHLLAQEEISEMDASLAPIYSGGDVAVLRARLELWERMTDRPLLWSTPTESLDLQCGLFITGIASISSIYIKSLDDLRTRVMAYIHPRMLHSDNSPFDSVVPIFAFFILGVLAARMIRRCHLANSPGRFVRFRAHVDDPVASMIPMAVLRYNERRAQRHAVADGHHETISSLSFQTISAPLR
ncbi:hypothetical protein SCLCIDRAFT_34009 [Scleroderma citrinum Foug A]|uniref:Uncharacterized protein n=1 Tax=Scleroderma citrinum Foug A TaxID=1036808 RepID=A0A0C2YLX6_9AGAM|nr:hypothetical protein SCLCIDRAFT_34009 [Scleroderma citrinum Foug A]